MELGKIEPMHTLRAKNLTEIQSLGLPIQIHKLIQEVNSNADWNDKWKQVYRLYKTGNVMGLADREEEETCWESD